jgi:hypothetical protein
VLVPFVEAPHLVALPLRQVHGAGVTTDPKSSDGGGLAALMTRPAT